MGNIPEEEVIVELEVVSFVFIRGHEGRERNDVPHDGDGKRERQKEMAREAVNKKK